jgi:hypothetical protein
MGPEAVAASPGDAISSIFIEDGTLRPAAVAQNQKTPRDPDEVVSV